MGRDKKNGGETNSYTTLTGATQFSRMSQLHPWIKLMQL
ncbi:hypothetical protein AWU68_1725 [Corynebacterium simulans]|nr:hypothetical protein AWU68_1725 [Corynebacterium simulans]